MSDDMQLTVKVAMESQGFQQQISNINRSMKVVQSEFNNASSKLKDFGKTTEGLKSKTESLSKQLELQKQKVIMYTDAHNKAKNTLEKNIVKNEELKTKLESVKKAYEDSKNATGKNLEETKKLKTELDKLDGEYKNNQNVISNNIRTIDNYNVKLNDSESSVNNLQRELKETNKTIDIQGSKWTKLSEKMQRTSEKMKKIGKGMRDVGQKLSLAVTLPLAAVGAASTKMAMDAVESENLFEVSMGKMGKSARDWSEKTSKALGLNAYEVRKNVGTFNVMLGSMGATEQQSLEMSEGMTQLSYDMASFYNLKPEEAFDKLRSGISGETEPLKRLGILVNETTVKSYAMKHGIGTLTKTKKGFKLELSETEKVMARYGLIMQSTSKAQGDMARTADSPANKLRIMQQRFQMLQIEVGKVLIPTFMSLIDIIKPAIEKFNSMSNSGKKMVVVIGAIAMILPPIIIAFSTLFTIISNGIGLFSKASKAIGEAGGVMKLLASPGGKIALVIGSLVLLGIAIYEIVKHWDVIKKKTIEVWTDMTGWIKKHALQIAIAFGPIGVAIYALVKNWDKIKKVTIDTFNKMVSGAKAGFTNICKAFDVIKELPKKALEWGKNIVDGIKNGIMNKIHAVKEAVTNITSTISNTIKEKLGIHSPSKIMHGYGKNVAEGMANGIVDNTHKVKKATQNMTETVAKTHQKHLKTLEKQRKAHLANVKKQVNTNITNLVNSTVKALIPLESKISQLTKVTKDNVKNIGNYKAAMVLLQQELKTLNVEYLKMIKLKGKNSSSSNAILKKITQVKNAYTGLGQKIKDTNDKIQESMQKQKEKTIESMNNLGDKIKDSLKKRYEDELKSYEDKTDKEIDENDRWKENTIKGIEDVHETRIRRLDDEFKAYERNINEKINKLEGKEKQHDTEIKDTEDTEKEKQLRQILQMNYSNKKKEETQKELNELLKTRDERHWKENIDTQKSTLQTQLEAKKQDVEGSKEVLNRNFDNEKENIEKIWKNKKNAYDEEKEYYKNFYAEKLKDANLMAEVEKLIISNNQKEILSLLKSYGNDYEIAGASLGDRLVNGFKDKLNDLNSIMASVTSQINQIAGVSTKITTKDFKFNPINFASFAVAPIPSMMSSVVKNRTTNNNSNFSSLLHTDNIVLNDGMDIRNLATELFSYIEMQKRAKGGFSHA